MRLIKDLAPLDRDIVALSDDGLAFLLRVDQGRPVWVALPLLPQGKLPPMKETTEGDNP